MSLLTNANLLKFTDRLAWGYSQGKPVLGTATGNPVTGTVRGTISNLLADVMAFNDYDQTIALAGAVKVALSKATFESMFDWCSTLLQQNSSGPLYQHMVNFGPTVDASINSLATYLAYYNSTRFTCMVTPDFAALWLAMGQSALPAAGVMSPALHPDYTSGVSANGMGTKNVAGTFGAGTSVTNATYSEVAPVIEVTTDFSGGGAPPTVAGAGTDDQGNACTWTAVALAGNNPTAALSGLTVTPAITAASRQTVAVSSSTGIVTGSVLTINKGLPDQEVVIVEAVPDGTHVTAVFKTAHGAGATIDGKNSYAVGNLSTGAGRRLRSLSGLTLTLSSHAAGAVRVVGRQDRVAI